MPFPASVYPCVEMKGERGLRWHQLALNNLQSPPGAGLGTTPELQVWGQEFLWMWGLGSLRMGEHWALQKGGQAEQGTVHGRLCREGTRSFEDEGTRLSAQQGDRGALRQGGTWGALKTGEQESLKKWGQGEMRDRGLCKRRMEALQIRRGQGEQGSLQREGTGIPIDDETRGSLKGEWGLCRSGGDKGNRVPCRRRGQEPGQTERDRGEGSLQKERSEILAGGGDKGLADRRGTECLQTGEPQIPTNRTNLPPAVPRSPRSCPRLCCAHSRARWERGLSPAVPSPIPRGRRGAGMAARPPPGTGTAHARPRPHRAAPAWNLQAVLMH